MLCATRKTAGTQKKIRRRPTESRRCGGRRAVAMPLGGLHGRGLLAMVEDDLTKLSEQEEQVLRLLFGIGEVLHSREEVGRRLGMSRSWLRQIVRRAR